jgi:hypothetical protein
MSQMERAQHRRELRAGAKSAHPGGTRSNKTGFTDYNRPQVHDLTKDLLGYGIRPSTAIQVQQLQKITEFNKALPKKKQNSALPLIQATNIGT